ncbi:MAG: zinc-ribbon domain-containing protein [Candidatus Hermodarchaeota archaeon]
MSEVRKHIWIMPFIGSIITAISLFTPTFLYPGTPVPGNMIIRFMNGFYLIVGGGIPVPYFVGIPSLMIVGIVSTILLVVCTIILFISPLTHRNKETPGSWIVLGILLIGGTIFFIAGTELGYFIYHIINYGTPASFFQGAIPSFAVIGPFIGGGLSIIGFIIGKTAGGKEEVEIKPISKEQPPVVKEEPQIPEEVVPLVSESVEEPHMVNFCAVCGEKIPDAEAKFCPGCGYNLKSD